MCGVRGIGVLGFSGVPTPEGRPRWRLSLVCYSREEVSSVSSESSFPFCLCDGPDWRNGGEDPFLKQNALSSPDEEESHLFEPVS